jgi:four helix bundle protein
MLSKFNDKSAQKALIFSTKASFERSLLETIPKNHSVHNQLDRASTSIPLNIAEGNEKHTSADRCRYFDIARGSALECAACLDVLVAKKKIDEDKAKKGKDRLFS